MVGHSAKSELRPWAWAVRASAGLVLAVCIGLGAQAPASANGNLVEVANTVTTRIKVARGKPRTIKTSAAFYEIVVGDPETANVTPLTNRSFYVLGRELGTTGIALFDENKRLVGSIDVEVTLDEEQLASTIRETVPGSNIKVDSANGRLVLSGSAKDSVAAKKASDIAARFSGEEQVIDSVKIDSSQQVQLNVRFVEINRQIGHELGAKLAGVYQWGDGAVSFNSQPNATSNVPAGDVMTSLMSGGLSVDLAIEALEDRGMARRLAEPNLIARSGESASFLAGGEFPIPVDSGDDTISVDYKRYGVSLDFTPQVLDDGLIALTIAPEVSSIDTSSSYNIGDLSIPGFVVRRAKTSVDLKSGQSFMMAGLLQSQNDLSTQGIPGLSRLPVLGTLFSSKSYQRRETELVIIITPYLVRPIDPSKKPATPFDGSKAPNTADVFLGNMQEMRVSDAGQGARVSAASGGHYLELSGGARP